MIFGLLKVSLEKRIGIEREHRIEWNFHESISCIDAVCVENKQIHKQKAMD